MKNATFSNTEIKNIAKNLKQNLSAFILKKISKVQNMISQQATGTYLKRYKADYRQKRKPTSVTQTLKPSQLH